MGPRATREAWEGAGRRGRPRGDRGIGGGCAILEALVCWEEQCWAGLVTPAGARSPTCSPPLNPNPHAFPSLCGPLVQAIGKPHTLWVAFAKLYERHQDLPNARIIFEKATQVGPGGAACGRLGRPVSRGVVGEQLAHAGPHGMLCCCASTSRRPWRPCRPPPTPKPIPATQLCTRIISRTPAHTWTAPLPTPTCQAPYKYVDDLASVWCEWCEMELRHKNFKRALELMRRATAPPPRPRKREVCAGLVWVLGWGSLWCGCECLWGCSERWQGLAAGRPAWVAGPCRAPAAG